MKHILKAIIFLKEHRIKTFLFIYFLGIFVSIVLFDNHPVLALYNSAALFALDVRVQMPESIMWYHYSIHFLALIAALYTVLSIFELFAKEKISEIIKEDIINEGQHIVVFGLSDNNQMYIDSELEDRENKNKIIVIESNRLDRDLEYYYTDDVSIIFGDGGSVDLLNDLNLENSKHIVVSTGNDMLNLEVSTQILKLFPNIKLFVHIEDYSLRHFHKERGLISGTNVKVYSYYEETARALFLEYDIDGSSMEIINSSETFSIAVVGNTSLAYEVIAQACIMGQLPHENIMKIYCISDDSHSFKSNVELQFSEISNVPNIEFIYIELNEDTKSFYTHNLWFDNMTNAILCFENDQKNLDIASSLSNITYLNTIIEKQMKTKILVAMFGEYALSEAIKKNETVFDHLHVFGRTNDINDKRYIISGERDKQAIATDFIYNNIEPKVVDYDNYKYEYSAYNNINYERTGFIEVNDVGWTSLSYFKKESNRAVADQIKMKLKYLGLMTVKSDVIDTKQLYIKNRKIFDNKIKDRVLLAKMEHNRWNTFHYLNGYKAIEFVSKENKNALNELYEAKKEHMCLVKFDKFKEKSEQLEELGYEEGKFEGYDFMINEHIPLILANAGYSIKISAKIGVTGHRVLDNKEQIIEQFKEELTILSQIYQFQEVISPLADGSDRLVADVMMSRYNSKLIVPLPFEENAYKKDFSEESQAEFDDLLKKSYDAYKVCSLEENTRDECYFNTGKEVVNECDILIAFWNGKPAKGLGGTADIVVYAKEKGKKILQIDTLKLKVNKINFKG